MPGPTSDAEDFDAQDLAETFDETNSRGEGDEVGEARSFTSDADETTSEDTPDVLDLMQVAGDRDDDEAVALDADEFSEDAIDDVDLEDDNELNYAAATEEREDDIDGLGPEDGFNEDALDMRTEIEGLDEEVLDADSVEGGEDDFTNFQSKTVSDEDLKDMGYAEGKDGDVRAKPAR